MNKTIQRKVRTFKLSDYVDEAVGWLKNNATVEDSVEIEIDGIVQATVRREIEISVEYADGKKEIL